MRILEKRLIISRVLFQRLQLLYRPSFANQLDDHIRAVASSSSSGRASRRNVVLTNYSNANDGGGGSGGRGNGGNERSRGSRRVSKAKRTTAGAASLM